ncbi:MAG: amino acid ABC transporter permease [Lachnospiraceae bacterium]|jgi:polar amino acid transport system permease protein|nr:amino acid ABC transporter permease [Lachnospiraceae bacterium]
MSIGVMFRELMGGMGVTVSIFFLTLLFSLPLGLVVAFLRMSRLKPVSLITGIYISIMRGTPLMLQLIVIYFSPYYVFHVKISSSFRFVAVIIAFALNYAAYFAEIYRSGIQSVPRGQYEAAHVLGYDRRQTFARIILPQVLKRVLPPITNEVITLVKDTSLSFAIATAEMFTIAKQIAAKEASIMPLMAAGLFYYIFNLVVAWACERLEKHYSYYRI